MTIRDAPDLTDLAMNTSGQIKSSGLDQITLTTNDVVAANGLNVNRTQVLVGDRQLLDANAGLHGGDVGGGPDQLEHRLQQRGGHGHQHQDYGLCRGRHASVSSHFFNFPRGVSEIFASSQSV